MSTTTASALLKKVTGGALGDYPSLGLSMRFMVEVEGKDVEGSQIQNLGLWQSCKGLSVELKYRKFRQGGQYTQEVILPEELAYGKIKLERAVSAKDSTIVQKWLQGYVQDWNEYVTTAGASPASTTVIITLLDYQLNSVMTWTLYQARPSKWEGPSLSATDSKVAIESLEFEHEGFLLPATGE
jgi:phage tail-like protein